MIKNISNLGDAALYCDFGTEVNKQINSEVIKYFNTIKENNIKGVNNLTPSYNKLIISYDLKVTNFREIKHEIEKLSNSRSQSNHRRLWRIIMSTIKMRSKESNGVVTVKALIKHPMETGQRKNKKTGDMIPAHYIQEVHSKANGKDVITIHWGPAVSKNPYLTFKYKGNKGDDVEISWVDNQGNKDTKIGKVK